VASGLGDGHGVVRHGMVGVVREYYIMVWLGVEGTRMNSGESGCTVKGLGVLSKGFSVACAASSRQLLADLHACHESVPLV
jgi:hypothetical protein